MPSNTQLGHYRGWEFAAKHGYDFLPLHLYNGVGILSRK